MSFFHIEDLPDEIMLNIVSYLNIKGRLKFSQTSKKIRAICHDESLWQKVNLCSKRVPTEFIQLVLENGCKYLNLANAMLEGNLSLKQSSQLRYV